MSSSADFRGEVSSLSWSSNPGEISDPNRDERRGEAPGHHDGGGETQGLRDYGKDRRASQDAEIPVSFHVYYITTRLTIFLPTTFFNTLVAGKKSAIKSESERRSNSWKVYGKRWRRCCSEKERRRWTLKISRWSPQSNTHSFSLPVQWCIFILTSLWWPFFRH